MKVDRKTKAAKSPPAVKTVKGGRRAAPRTNGNLPLAGYEHIPVGIVEVSLDGNYIDVNEEFCRILGYSRQELLRLGIKDCTHEDDYSIDAKLYEQLIAGKIPFYRLEKRYLRRGGGEIWVELTRTLVCDAKGKPRYTVGVVLDISDRKDVERVLRDSVERLRLATGVAQMFMWEWDFQTQSYILADNFEKVLGFSAGLLPRNKFETIWALSPQEDVQRISESFEKAVENQTDLSTLLCRVINPENGHIVWLEVSAKIIYDEQGNPQRMFGVAQNITENKNIQDEITVISRVPEENPDPIMRFKPEGKVLYANPACAALLEDWTQDMQPVIPDELLTTITQASTSGVKTDVEFGYHGKHFSFTVVPFADSGYVNLYGKDITQRKQAEQTLREKDEQLRHVTDITPVLFSQCSRDLRYIFVNRTAAEFLGSTPEEIAGKPIWQIIGAEAFETIQPYIDRVLMGERVEYEMEIPYRAAGRRFMHVVYVPDRNDRGIVVGWIATVTDITERKRMEQALAESARQEETLYKLADQLNRTNSLEDVFNAALDAILNGLQCDRASILLYDDSDVMRFVAWRGLSDAYRKAIDGHSPWKPDGRDPQPVIMDDVGAAELEDALRAVIQREGIGALAFIPLMVNEKLIGKFMVYYDAPHVFDQAEIDLSLTIAHQLAFGIDRKRTEQTLKRERELLERLFETMPVMVSMVDPATNSMRMNAEFERRIGWRSDEVGVVSLLEALYPDPEYRQSVLQRMAMAAGTNEWVEVQVRRRDGNIMDSMWANISITEGDKLITGIALGVDITERKRAEEALRRNEQMFSTLVDAAPFGVYFIDSEFRLRSINKGAEAVFSGIYPLIGRDFAEILRIIWPEPFATEAIERFRHTLGTGESFISPPIIEKRANRDEIESYDWQIHRITLPDGTYGAVCYFYDLSEQKRMEATLRASEELYRTIARSIPGGGVYVVDKDFRYLVAEGPVTETFGLTREMLEGHTVSEAFPDERGKHMQERLRQNFAGETVSFETLHNGRVYWTQQAPLLDSIGHVIILTLDITERKQAEEALRQSEERFARFMQHLPGLAWIKDTQGRYVYANAAAEKAFNTPREKLYGKTDQDIFPPEVAALFRRNDAQALADEKGVQVIETLQHQDGVLHSSLVSKFPIPALDGSTALIGGTAFDITERLRAEEALRESEERFRAILRQATAGIVLKDADGYLIFVNEAFCSMLGRTEEELLGKTIWEFMHPDDIAENKRSYERLMLEGIPFRLERRFMREDGSIIWADASISPIMDADGKPQSAIAVEVDITGRKQAEDALQQLNLQLEDRVLSRTAKLREVNQTLREEIKERRKVEQALRKSEATARENEEKLSTLFNLLPVGISFLDPQGQIIQMNPALANILKLSDEQVADGSYRSRRYVRANGTLMHPAEFASQRAVTEGRTIYNVETGVQLEEGELIWTSVSAAPVNVADVGAVVVTVDITESKLAERALQESRERLQILSQRLVEVQEDERRAIARELHDRVGQTLAALNINLIIISGQLGGKVDEQISTRLNDSMKLVAETIALVRDVMSNLRPSVLDDYGLEAAIESHLAQYRARYEINTIFEKPESPLPRLGPSIEMTFLRIAQEALMNIAKHAHASQVTVRLGHEQNAICMTIQDNGIGIESWSEANQSGSHGLTIMRERAEAFGGSIKVSSVPGKGTKVDVSIPAEPNNPPQAQKETGQ